jgi:dTDP-4-dehydrorhamnose reductase
VKALVDQYVSPTLNTNLAQMLIEIAERRLCAISTQLNQQGK